MRTKKGTSLGGEGETPRGWSEAKNRGIGAEEVIRVVVQC